MPYEDKNFRGSLVLDFGIWWRHVKTIYGENANRRISKNSQPSLFEDALTIIIRARSVHRVDNILIYVDAYFGKLHF